MKSNNRLIFIPYHDIATPLALGGEEFTVAFSTHQASDVMIVSVYIGFEELSHLEIFHVKVPLDTNQTEQDFIDTFSNSLVNLSFLDKDEKIGGFKIIRNPILF